MKQHKLLLADDSITIQKVVNLTFADEGIEVISADNGDTALELFHERVPDLVMIDVNMPGLNGYDLCEYIKTNELSKNIPVILLVGSFEPFNQTRAQQAKADDYMTKPFQSIRELVSKVTGLLPSENGKSQSAFDHEADTMEFSTEEFAPPQSAAQNFQSQTPIVAYPLDETGKFEIRHGDAEQIEAAEIADYEVKTDDDLQITESTPDYQASETKLKENEFMFDFDDADFLELPPINKSAKEKEKTDSFTKPADNISIPETADQPNNEKSAAKEISATEIKEQLDLQNFSPDVIDAIAEKVVEKLTARMKE